MSDGGSRGTAVEARPEQARWEAAPPGPRAVATFQVFRGDRTGGELRAYQVPVTEGMVVLDAIHYIQHHLDSTLACRWNCKAAKWARAARR